MSAINILHSSQSDSWLTPLHILDKVRNVFGGTIDLDPASSEFANTRVNAQNYFTKEYGGLNQNWFGNVFINPPGGKLNGKSLTALFWQKLMQENLKGNIEQAIFLAFSAEALQNTQRKSVPSLGSSLFCIPAKRIQFDYPGPAIKKAPSHSNVIAYVTGRVDNSDSFIEEFISVGQLCEGVKAF